jgi:hypothetical protein
VWRVFRWQRYEKIIYTPNKKEEKTINLELILWKGRKNNMKKVAKIFGGFRYFL